MLLSSIKNFQPSVIRKLRKLEKLKSKRDSYEVVKQIDILNLKLKIADTVCAILGCGHSWLMFIESVIYSHSYDNRDASSTKSSSSPMSSFLLRVVCFLFTVGLIFALYRRYQFKLLIKKLERGDDVTTSLWYDRELRNTMAIEMAVCCIFLPPKVDHYFRGNIEDGHIEYTLDMLFTQIILLKSYNLIRVYEHFSMWTNL